MNTEKQWSDLGREVAGAIADCPSITVKLEASDGLWCATLAVPQPGNRQIAQQTGFVTLADMANRIRKIRLNIVFTLGHAQAASHG